MKQHYTAVPIEDAKDKLILGQHYGFVANNGQVYGGTYCNEKGRPFFQMFATRYFASEIDGVLLPFVPAKGKEEIETLLSEIIEIVDKPEFNQESNEFKIWNLINDFGVLSNAGVKNKVEKIDPNIEVLKLIDEKIKSGEYVVEFGKDEKGNAISIVKKASPVSTFADNQMGKEEEIELLNKFLQWHLSAIDESNADGKMITTYEYFQWFKPYLFHSTNEGTPKKEVSDDEIKKQFSLFSLRAGQITHNTEVLPLELVIQVVRSLPSESALKQEEKKE